MSARVSVVKEIGKMKGVDLHIDKRTVKPVAATLHAKEVLCVNVLVFGQGLCAESMHRQR